MRPNYLIRHWYSDGQFGGFQYFDKFIDAINEYENHKKKYADCRVSFTGKMMEEKT